MNGQPPIVPPTPLTLILRGTLLGALAGTVLASIYAAAAPAGVAAWLVSTNSSSGRVFDALLGAGVLGVCAGPFALVLGILPGMLLGAASGLVIGLLAAPFHSTLSSWGGAVIGLLVAVVIVAGGNLLLGPGMIEPNRPEPDRYFPYLFWIAGPSLLILLGLPIVGWLLPRNTRRWFRRPRT